jgi:hypothetical protein
MPHGFAHHPSLPGGASFILWLQCGRLVTLEGFTNTVNGRVGGRGCDGGRLACRSRR